MRGAMSRWSRAVLLCVFILTPAAARADDGGFLDWLFRLDPKFRGIASDFHALCLDKDGKKMDGCEEYFGLWLILHRGVKPIAFADIKHEVNIRLAYYRTYGDLYPENTSDTINALKLMALY